MIAAPFDTLAEMAASICLISTIVAMVLVMIPNMPVITVFVVLSITMTFSLVSVVHQLCTRCAQKSDLEMATPKSQSRTEMPSQKESSILEYPH